MALQWYPSLTLDGSWCGQIHICMNVIRQQCIHINPPSKGDTEHLCAWNVWFCSCGSLRSGLRSGPVRSGEVKGFVGLVSFQSNAAVSLRYLTINVWPVILTDVTNCQIIYLPESSESLLSGASSMSSSDISISSSRLMPISCSLCMFLISCKTQQNQGWVRPAWVIHILAGASRGIINRVTF